MVFIILGCVVVLLAVLYLFLIVGEQPTKKQAAPFRNLNCAHRGLFEADQSVPENTLRAFERAVEHGYGVELDVQLSRDGEVVVFHDDTVDRETEYTGRVDSFTLAELQSMSLFGTHGDKLGIPLFTDVMEVLDGKSPTIVELKSTENYPELCEKTLAILRGCKGPYCVESFDPRIVRWFREFAPDLMRGQLSEQYSGWRKTVNPFAAFALSHFWTNVVTRPHFLAYGSMKQPLGLLFNKLICVFTVYWTEKPESDRKTLEQRYDCIIFQHFLPKPKFK
ncbi:MAG: glycerophosphodiester phosphodiesterase [Clostridia bacterium]|nr:glycerophosphodiester phosphodiesterase [Clostridia bacterium]